MIVKMNDNKQNIFSIKEAFKFGWQETKKRVWFLALLIFVVFLVYNIPGFVAKKIQSDLPFIAFILFVLAVILYYLVEIGLIRISLDIYDSGQARIEDLFKRYQILFRYFVTSISYSLLVLLGIFILIIPGIIIAVSFQFFGFLMVDRNLSIVDSLKTSARITKGYRWKIFFLNLSILGVNTLGILAFGIGILVSIPVSLLTLVYTYRFLERQEKEKIKKE